ncbi:glycosyltransferase [Eggerthellaceae bacterium zg-997]|nr:glycosyltransferase [Eggerthellaceae bacterium zg-997]
MDERVEAPAGARMGESAGEPTVSVLVPCYNVERYLEQCLDSLRAQTIADMEVICIDDGSTDGTGAIIDRYCALDGRFRAVRKPNSGYGASMNRGLREARGTYVGILESDDFCAPQTFERLCAAARDAGAQAAKAGFFLHWSEPEPRDQLKSVVGGTLGGVVDPREHPELFWFMPSIWSAVYERRFLDRHDIRFLETPGASYQDLSFTFKVWAHAARVALLDEAFVRYRQDNEASSIHAPGKVFCVCDEFAQIEEFIEGRPDRDRLWPVAMRLKFDSYFWNYWRLSPDLREGFLARFAEEFRIARAAHRVDMSMLPPWSQVDLLHITGDPADYHAWALRTQGRPGSLAALARYARWGGPGLLLRRLLYRG